MTGSDYFPDFDEEDWARWMESIVPAHYPEEQEDTHIAGVLYVSVFWRCVCGKAGSYFDGGIVCYVCQRPICSQCIDTHNDALGV